MENKFTTGLQVGIMIAAVFAMLIDADIVSVHFAAFILLLIAVLTVMFDDSPPNKYA